MVWQAVSVVQSKKRSEKNLNIGLNLKVLILKFQARYQKNFLISKEFIVFVHVLFWAIWISTLYCYRSIFEP